MQKHSKHAYDICYGNNYKLDKKCHKNIYYGYIYIYLYIYYVWWISMINNMTSSCNIEKCILFHGVTALFKVTKTLFWFCNPSIENHAKDFYITSHSRCLDNLLPLS